MLRHTRLRLLAIPLAAALGVAALSAPRPAEAATTTPVRCRVWINDTLTDQNVPVECTTPDGTVHENVPPGKYLHVTDVFLHRRLGTQTTVSASVRRWEESGLSATGCESGGVVGSFVNDHFLTLPEAEGQLHIRYGTPLLVLTPNDCLAVYTSTAGGVVVEATGLLADSPHIATIALSEPSAFSGASLQTLALLTVLAVVGAARWRTASSGASGS